MSADNNYVREKMMEIWMEGIKNGLSEDEIIRQVEKTIQELKAEYKAFLDGMNGRLQVLYGPARNVSADMEQMLSENTAEGKDTSNIK